MIPRKTRSHWVRSSGRTERLRKIPLDVPPRRKVAGRGLRVVTEDIALPMSDREITAREVIGKRCNRHEDGLVTAQDLEIEYGKLMECWFDGAASKTDCCYPITQETYGYYSKSRNWLQP
jgi:hypothetical protein